VSSTLLIYATVLIDSIGRLSPGG